MSNKISYEIVEEMVRHQEQRLFHIALQLHPHLAPEDVLQPQDFPELEGSVLFQYEEGILVGLKNALAALRAEESQVLALARA